MTDVSKFLAPVALGAMIGAAYPGLGWSLVIVVVFVGLAELIMHVPEKQETSTAEGGQSELPPHCGDAYNFRNN